ncbi:AbgT family transporter [Halalkalibacterium halodurans]|jgi:aminobenzoyl-glutamate transport protein|uniref:Aminobenzoyl-glutamate transporter n=1 Tax=Halalkalibacterium halodurans TaxID=86665 RepID=A0A0M0KC29_ALKHA|nr:AbgT family transporter [Halalkalibacterium halodurans]MED3647683.1 AbgT family transporter [Halalkalibacterium halodurans]TPE70317.1 AbgT family transporter [Halalkalibacterium halodurans]
MKPAPHVELKPNQRGVFVRFLDIIEKYGNKLPDPIMLFVIMAVLILICSAIFSALGTSAVHPGTGEEIGVVNLLNGEGFILILTELVNNFTSFPPLGLVLVVMLGVGVAESTGLLSALMKTTILNAPRKLILPTIVLVAMLGNAAADAAMVVLPPIVAMIFIALGRHPLAGLAAAYASVAGGFSANLILSMLDPLVAGFTQTGAQMIDPDYVANPAMNYYFLVASCLVLVPVAVWVTTKIVEPRLGTYTGEVEEITGVTKEEKKGLRWAGISVVILAVVFLFLTVPEQALLRDPETGSLTVSPFMTGIVPIMMVFFLVPALVYGFVAKVFTSSKDVADHLAKSMSNMGTYIVIAFVAAQMIAFFNWSQLGPIVAIKGANFLQTIGFTGLPLLLGFIVIAALINLMVASASAKWAILAPVFVPMFMLLEYSPAFTQAAYRVGDSITNPITPMLPYFAIALTFAKKYDPKIGIGTFMSSLLPYSIAFAVIWIILFTVWYLLGLPLGPGEYIHLHT